MAESSDKQRAAGAGGAKAGGKPGVRHMTVQFGERRVPFQCFDTNLGRTVNAEILAGKIYRWPDGVAPPRVVVDVGANVGAAALYFALSFPSAKIVAFEPAPECQPLLRENLQDFPNVKVEPYGLFDRNLRRRLFVGAQDAVTNSLGQSAYNTDAGPEVELKHAAEALFALKLTGMDCLKLDTEGSEVPILEALAPLVAETAVVFVEYHSEGDRRRIDLLLAGTHLLVGARVMGPHRGELTYARRDSYKDAGKRDRDLIRPPGRGT
jgi:FkbM family methyltransferase